MKKFKPILICFFLASLIVMLPVCFADEVRTTEGVTLAKSSDSSKDQKNGKAVQSASVANAFPGLVGWLAAILSAAGIIYIAVGAAVIVGGYLVYHVGKTAWTYYNAYKYLKLIEYKHINDFPNIWKKTPSRKDFEKKCKDNMNSKSVERYIQVKDGRSIAYNPSTLMLTVGDTNGKDIITCFPKKRADIDKEVSKGRWKKIE